MFGISTTEFLIILAVGLIVLGPQKLPELARALGKAIGEFRKATTEIKETFEADENIAAVRKTFDDAVAESMKHSFVKETVEEALSSGLAESMATSAAKEMEDIEKSPDKDWNKVTGTEQEFDFSEAADFTGEGIPVDPPPGSANKAKTDTPVQAAPADWDGDRDNEPETAAQPKTGPAAETDEKAEPEKTAPVKDKPAPATDTEQDGKEISDKA